MEFDHYLREYFSNQNLGLGKFEKLMIEAQQYQGTRFVENLAKLIGSIASANV
jgi:hypothetical protein